MERAAKAELVTELKGVFKTANTVVVAHNAGLTVAQMQTLRKQARASGTQVKVAKNRLAKIALEGTDVASIAPLLKGPTVIAYSGDPIAASKVAADFAKTHDIDLIVMGTIARTGIPGLFIGNTAESILQRVDCSVLAVKPDGFVSPVGLEG